MVYLQQHLDATFHALADPTRREILGRVAGGGRTIKELAARFAMTLPAVSKHVRVLERAGLTTVRRDGRARRVTLNAEPLGAAAAWIDQYRAFWEHQLDQLTAYLASTPSSPEAPAWPAERSAPAPAPNRRGGRSSKSGASSARRPSASPTRGRGPKNSNGGARRGR